MALYVPLENRVTKLCLALDHQLPANFTTDEKKFSRSSGHKLVLRAFWIIFKLPRNR